MNWLKPILAIILIAVSVTAHADIALDEARNNLVAAQANFADKYSKPEVLTNGKRNFARYIAKMERASQLVNNAQQNYNDALGQAQSTNPNFMDTQYQPAPGYESAAADYQKIRQEVGQQAIDEITSAYQGDEQMLDEL